MSEASASAVSRDIVHLTEKIEEGFDRMERSQAETNDCLRQLNGRVATNTLELVKQDTRIAHLESFRDLATRALLSGLGVGVGLAATVGGILFGIGKAVGWW